MEGGQFLTNRAGGGGLQPDNINQKTGKPVIKVLRSKHPSIRELLQIGEAEGRFEPYTSRPELVPLDCDPEAIEKVAAVLYGSTGLSGTEAVAFWNWLLLFGSASWKLRREFSPWVEWMANYHPPWVAIHIILVGNLTRCNKKPGTRPLGIGEVFHKLMTEMVVHLEERKTLKACGISNIAVRIL